MKNLNFTFFCIIIVCFLSACKKDKGSDNEKINGAYYVKGSINGTAIDWEETDGTTNWVTGSASNGSNDQGVFTGGLTALMSAMKGFQPQIGVDFRTIFVSYEDDKTAYFNNFVNTGSWAYAKTEDYKAGTKDLVIYYTDSQGKQYSSIGAQTRSVNVASVIEIPADLVHNESLKIKLTFGCILYPVDGTGSTIKLSNIEATLCLEDLIPL